MRLTLLGLLAALVLVGCTYVPARTTPEAPKASIAVQSPSPADYSLASEVEHTRRAQTVVDRVANLEKRIAELVAEGQSLADRLAELRADTTSLPSVRAANESFVLGRIAGVESRIGHLRSLAAGLQSGQGYELNRAHQSLRQAEVILGGGIPNPAS